MKSSLTKIASFALPFLVLVISVPAYAAFIRVDPSGGGDATTVAEAMLLASAGDTVAVRFGAHLVNNVQVTDGVALLGGWDSSFTSRVPGTSHLMSSAQQILRCTTGQGLDTVIDGFELTGASNSGILCTDSSPTITNNEFHANTAVDGGAIHCEMGASPFIAHNHIHHNTANLGGGIRGHWGYDTSPTIVENVIEYNTAFYGGGGISVNNGSSVIEDNVIRFNAAHGGQSATGGGIHVWHAEGGVVTVRRNLIIYNTSDEGGGIGITGGHPVIENNTLWGNSAFLGGALYQEESDVAPDPGVTQVHFNILGGSLQGHGVFVHEDYKMVLDCNCVHGNAGAAYAGVSPGLNDITDDPLLCDVSSGDFHLASNSPCAPPGPGGCGLIGAFDVGCGPIGIEALSWGTIKALYR
jgi:hypothetical protein